MRKILFSLMTMVLVVGLVGAGAFAYFSDVETSTGNTFTAGTIDIEVNDANPWSAAFDLYDMKPCEKKVILFKIKNVGNNDLNLWKHLEWEGYNDKELVYPVVDPVASSEPEYEAEGGPESHLPIVDIDHWITYSLYIDMDTSGTVTDGDIAIVAQKDHVKLFTRYCVWEEICNADGTPLGPLGPDEEVWILQDYHLQDDTGNEYQGDSVIFTITFYAEQLGGLGK